MTDIKSEVRRAVETLRQGGIILYPTDTVWGIGCDATNSDAVAKIYALKKSTDKKSMLVIVDSIDRAAVYTDNVPHVAWDLMEVTDKPLTLILPGAHGISHELIPDEGTIGIRVPDHEFCHQMCRMLGRPVVSTSANISGMTTPARFDEIDPAVKDGVDMVVDASFEADATGKASSIIAIDRSGAFKIIRP
ncbi:MAG: L-threonylcarbamoyladenylate synthase [Rikenellaceae bacterium]|nr:L-threonylcarbamoyladenylate synthase [Rikenellaceae bacterium]